MISFWIGTTGFSYREWSGPFYPPDLPESGLLAFYAQRFSTVEINASFHRLPSVRTLQAWAKETPERFVFALKAPRRITHDLRLRDAGDLVTHFCDTASVLEGKLGVLLFQIPSFLRQDVPRLEDFLHQLPPEFRYAFEFRNASWFSDGVFDCLRRFGAAMCVWEHADRAAPWEITTDYGYLRLRRPDYTDAELAAWAERLATSRLSDVYVYFKHEADARGPQLAERLSRLLGTDDAPALVQQA